MSTVRDMLRKKGGDVFMISPDITVLEALKLMAQHNTGALVVVNGPPPAAFQATTPAAAAGCTPVARSCRRAGA